MINKEDCLICETCNRYQKITEGYPLFTKCKKCGCEVCYWCVSFRFNEGVYCEKCEKERSK